MICQRANISWHIIQVITWGKFIDWTKNLCKWFFSFFPFSHLNIYLANSTSRPSSSFVRFILSLTNHSTSYTRSRVRQDTREEKANKKKEERRENNYSAIVTTTNQNTYTYIHIHTYTSISLLKIIRSRSRTRLFTLKNACWSFCTLSITTTY